MTISLYKTIYKSINRIAQEIKANRESPKFKRIALPNSIYNRGQEQIVCSKKDLTIICVAYKRHHPMVTLIESLLSQSFRNFKLILIHDGYDKNIEVILEYYKNTYPSEIEFIFTNKRYNDYGHSLRSLGLQMTDTEYVLITNDDNYYLPNFIKYMFYAINHDTPNKPDIIFCDMIHGHLNPGQRLQPPNTYFRTLPIREYIDMGCFIVKTNLARAAGFRDRSFAADATFLEDVISLEKNISIKKIPLVLFVHN